MLALCAISSVRLSCLFKQLSARSHIYREQAKDRGEWLFVAATSTSTRCVASTPLSGSLRVFLRQLPCALAQPPRFAPPPPKPPQTPCTRNPISTPEVIHTKR